MGCNCYKKNKRQKPNDFQDNKYTNNNINDYTSHNNLIVKNINKEINNNKNIKISKNEEVKYIGYKIEVKENKMKEDEELLKLKKENKKLRDENKTIEKLKKKIEIFEKKEKKLEENEQENINIKNEFNNLLIKYNELKKEKEPILVGLNNIGATCYMNATLQCLSNTYELTNYFLKNFNYNENDNNKIMSNEYYKLIKNLWNRKNNNKSFSPESFKDVLSKANPLFAGIQANDSKDLINFLIESLHKELNLSNENNIKVNNYIANQNDQLDENKMLTIFLNEFQTNYNSIISNLFYGVMETKSQCQKCYNIKYNFQIYSFVEFPLEQVNIYCFNTGKRNNVMNNNNKNPDVDLYECFEYYIKMDLMNGDNQMYCNICNCLCDALYGTCLYSAPNFLIINLNRGKNAVYECNVNFPEKLNLLNYVTYKKGNTYFELYGVICHLGPSSMSGHFIAFCKNKIDKKWYKYNDAFVTRCEKDNEYLLGMPYILFYQVK